jgi:alanine racemase
VTTRSTVARIDLGALAHNYCTLDAFLRASTSGSDVGFPRRVSEPEFGTRVGNPSSTRIIGVVKANAYGHGAAEVARALETVGAPMLACADIDEGVHLRRSGVTAPILIFGALSVGDLDGLIDFSLTPTVSTPAAVIALEQMAARRGVRLACHLKIDTGMNRLGFRHDQLDRTMPPIAASERLVVDAVYTHFATADDPEHPLFSEQRARFDRALVRLGDLGIRPRARHAANSAAMLRDERVWFDFVRPGLLLYGVAPPPLATTLDLRPVMSLGSRIVAVKGIRPGEGVSYGMRFVTDVPRRVAVVPAGYADGLDTRLANRGDVLVRGRRARVVGAVCMDMLIIDVTNLDVAPGDDVCIVGEQDGQRIDVREMAAAIGAIPWELLCRIGSRIERVYAQ